MLRVTVTSILLISTYNRKKSISVLQPGVIQAAVLLQLSTVENVCDSLENPNNSYVDSSITAGITFWVFSPGHHIGNHKGCVISPSFFDSFDIVRLHTMTRKDCCFKSYGSRSV